MRSAAWRERLPSALAAIAVQAGLAALVVFSFQVVRHLAPEKETVLTLQRLQRPAPARAPLVIDGRGRPPPAAAAPAGPLPAYARPGLQFSLPQNGGAAQMQELGRDLAACRIENYASLSPSQRLRCPPSPQVARHDPDPLAPEKPVKNVPVWQAEVARKNAPFALPGASGGVLGILGALLSGAFDDKRNYSYAPPDQPPLQDGAEMTRQYALLNDHCLPLDDTTKRNCEYNTAATPTVALGGMVYPSHPHVSDAAFKEALAAVMARKQSLSPRPVLASGAKTGGDDERNGLSGGAGAAAGGTGGTGR